MNEYLFKKKIWRKLFWSKGRNLNMKGQICSSVIIIKSWITALKVHEANKKFTSIHECNFKMTLKELASILIVLFRFRLL